MATVPDEIEKLLTEDPRQIHLATSVDDRPHVAPVWFHYRDETVEVLTSGKKLENVRENPRVALSIDKFVDGSAEWMVGLQGTARIVEDPEATRGAMERVYSRYLGPKEEWPELFQEQYDDVSRTFLEISIGSATGLY